MKSIINKALNPGPNQTANQSFQLVGRDGEKSSVLPGSQPAVVPVWQQPMWSLHAAARHTDYRRRAQRAKLQFHAESLRNPLWASCTSRPEWTLKVGALMASEHLHSYTGQGGVGGGVRFGVSWCVRCCSTHIVNSISHPINPAAGKTEHKTFVRLMTTVLQRPEWVQVGGWGGWGSTGTAH